MRFVMDSLVGWYLHGANHYQATMPVCLYVHVQGRVPDSHKLSSTFREETSSCGLKSGVTWRVECQTFI